MPKDMRRNKFKSPYSMRRGSISEDRIDKIERNLILTIDSKALLIERVNEIFDNVHRRLNRLDGGRWVND